VDTIRRIKDLIWQLDEASYETGADRGDLGEVERLRVEIFALLDGLSAPSLANEPMEPEKLVGEPLTPKPDGECGYYDYGKTCDEWECAPVAIRDRRVIWDWVRNETPEQRIARLRREEQGLVDENILLLKRGASGDS
jgi:hypothetical protein